MSDDQDDIRSGLQYRLLLKRRGEEYAELFAAPEEERLAYITWWASNFDTESDQIAALGLAPEYFASLDDARKFLKEMGG